MKLVSQFVWPYQNSQSASPTHDCLIYLSSPSFCQIKSAAASTTMKLSIKSFMDEHKDSYPYSYVPCTRQGYYPKWLLATSKTGYYAIKSSCLSHENIQNLIISYDGIPLPAEFCEVVDYLEKWGAFHWSIWMEKSLQLMYEYMREDNMYGGVGPARMRLFHDCILLCAQWNAGLSHHSNSADYNLVLTNWNTYYWVCCLEVASFHKLAVDSINHVRGMLECIEREGPVTQAFQSTQLRQLARVHVVPESPTSN